MEQNIKVGHLSEAVDIQITIPSTGNENKDKGIDYFLKGIVKEFTEEVELLAKAPDVMPLLATQHIKIIELKMKGLL